MMQQNVQAAAEASGAESKSGGVRVGRRWWFVGAVLVFAASTVGMLMQGGAEDALRPREFLTWEWFRSPGERNTIARDGSALVTADLNAVAVRKGEKGLEIYVVGSGGTILSGGDGGKGWTAHEVAPMPPAKPDYRKGELKSGARGSWPVEMLASAGDGAGLALALVDVKNAQAPPDTGQRGPELKPIGEKETEDPARGNVNNAAAQRSPEGTGPATQPVVPRFSRELYAVMFDKNGVGWAVGAGASFVTSGGDGQSWTDLSPELPSFGHSRALRAIYWFGSYVVALGDRERVKLIGEGPRKDAVYPIDFRPDATIFGVSDFACGEGGIYVDDKAKSVQLVYPTPHVSLRAISMVRDPKTGEPGRDGGWAVGDAGTILKYAGGSWKDAPWGEGLQKKETLHGVYCIDATHAIAVGDAGTILATTDGTNWSARVSNTTNSLRGVTFADAQNGWAVGQHGTVLATADGGQTWEHRTRAWHESLVMLGGRSWWIDEKGKLVLSSAAGATTRPVNGAAANLRFLAVTFPNQDVGFAVASEPGATASGGGSLYGTVNGGAEWEPVKTRAPLPALVSVHFDTPTSGWAVAADGKVWQSADAGRSWVQEMPAYSRTPAPWYYVSLALVLAFLAPAVPRPVKESAAVAGSPEPVTSAKGSAVDAPKSVGAVANILVSDKPLEEPDPRVDMLELNAIALALSNFLRNENTRPPLTIAVTAKWGAGKTSLMNLTARDLRRFGVQPVYFNPWHHQAEADLAAFLFQSILQRGIPRFLDPTGAGLLFRLKLLRVRWARYRVKAFAVAVTAALILGYLLASGTSPWGALAEFVPAVMALVTWLIAQFNGSGGGASDSPVSGSGASSLVFIGTMIAVIGSIYRGLTSFGVKPAQLLVSSGEASTSKERESKTAFRERFARDFADVTRALDPRDMLILIDDLDRCQHATVLNVLEGVNFLTSNGDCFVMLGMDQEIVRRAVGLGFKELAQEIALYDKPVGWEARTPLELEQMARDKFARQYLEKLVNIFVPVPVAGPEQVAAMLTQGAGGQPAAAKQWSEQEKKNEAERVARDARRRRWVDAARWGVRTASFALLFVLPVALCFYGGTWVYRTLGRIHAPPPQRVATTKPAAPATQPTTVVVTLALPGLNVVMPGISLIGPTTAPSAAGAPDNRAQPTTGPSTQSVDPGNTFGELVKDNGAPAGVAGAPGAAVWWPIGLGMLLAGAGVWLGFFTPDVVTRDSETFSKTLNELRALIYDPERSTPRSVKRFINRVRFIAMRQRRQKSYLTPYDNFVEWLMGLFETKEEKQRKNEEELAAQLRLPRLLTDDVVVALGALQEYLGADWDPKLTFSQLLVKAQEKGLAGDLLDYYTSRSAELSAGLAEYVRLTSGLRVA